MTDVNPFLFGYTISTKDEQVVKEASPVAFFNLAFKSLGVVIPGSWFITSHKDKVWTLSQPGCHAANAAMIGEALSQSGDSTHKAERNFSLITRIADDRRNDYEAEMADAQAVAASTDVIRAAAARAASVVSLFLDATRNTLRETDDRLTSAEESLANALRAQESVPAFRLQCVALAAFQDSIIAHIKMARQDEDALRNVRNQVQVAHRHLVTTIDDPAAYFAMLLLPRYDKPTDLTVNVTRKLASTSAAGASLSGFPAPIAPRTASPITAQNGATSITTTTVVSAGAGAVPPAAAPQEGGSLFSTHRLHFGGPARLSVSAGVLGSTLRNPQYTASRRHIAPVPGQSNDTSEFLVTLADSGNVRIIPAITLNTLVKSFDGLHGDGVHLVLGLALNTQADTKKLEYYFGAGIDVLDSRLMLTGGLYVGQKQSLGTLQLGERISQSAVPTVSVTRLGWAAGVTYRLY